MTSIVEQLREIQATSATLDGARMAARAADEIESLRRQLDLTRCELSVLMAKHCQCTPRQYAFWRAWDKCFDVLDGDEA